MRLAFIPSAYRTIFFHALSGRLEEAGHEVFWLSPNRRWAQWLCGHGVASDRILDITTYGPQWQHSPEPTADDRTLLGSLEQANGWSIYDLIIMDDLLRRRSCGYAVRYLAVCARQIDAFLQQHRIEIVFAEQTWAFELLTGQVSGRLGIPYLRPVSVRIPDGRFAFFASHYEKRMLRFGQPTDEDRAQARIFLQSYRGRPVPPDYAAIDLSVLRFEWARARLLIKHVLDLAGDPFDETSLRPLALIGKYLAMAARVRRNRWLVPFTKPVLPPPRPFVLFTLHQQPEASIDVMGNPFCNQIEIVRAMARTLPVTHELWVKEHPIALPKRSWQFYRELAAIPGVRLVDPSANSLTLIPHAALVVAVTGTVCYEAALLGRPSVTMGPTVFSPVLISDTFNPYTDSLSRLLQEVKEWHPRSERELIEFLSWLRAQSWPGSVGDALWLPDSLESANLARVADAFCAAMQACDKSPSDVPSQMGS